MESSGAGPAGHSTDLYHSIMLNMTFIGRDLSFFYLKA